MVLERRGSGRQGRDLLDHAQGDRGQLGAAVLLDRRLQVGREHGRTIAQRELHQVVEHRAQKPLHRLGARGVRRVARFVRVVVAPGDHARLDALYERAQRGEVGARVGARRRQDELLDLISDGALLSWSTRGRRAQKRVLKQMISWKPGFDLEYPLF